MVLVKENKFNFKVEIQDKILVVDEKKNKGRYLVIGRHWDKNKGSTIELKPLKTTAAQFYRLFIPQKTIDKSKKEICANIVGNQFKQYFTRPVAWETPSERL